MSNADVAHHPFAILWLCLPLGCALLCLWSACSHTLVNGVSLGLQFCLITCAWLCWDASFMAAAAWCLRVSVLIVCVAVLFHRPGTHHSSHPHRYSRHRQIAIHAVVPLFILCGRSNCFPLALFCCMTPLVWQWQQTYESAPCVAIPISLLTKILYFSLGHQNTLTSLPWEAAFYGSTATDAAASQPVLSACLVLVHVLCADLVAPWILILPSTEHSRSSRKTTLHHESLSLLLSFRLMEAAASALSACLQSQHLMFWEVYAPKSLFDWAHALATALSVSLCVWLSSQPRQLSTATPK